MTNVVEHGARSRTDDSDAPRVGWQGALAGGGEQALGGEARAALVQHFQQSPLTRQDKRVDDKLVSRARCVTRHPAGGHDLEPVLRFDVQSGAAEAHGLDFDLSFLQGEVTMSTRRQFVREHFAAHAHMPKFALDGAAQSRG